jgi:hypothetical protein
MRRFNVLQWPAKSPDLNPIENLWALIKSKLDIVIATDVEELQEQVTTAFNSIEDRMINSLVMSFENRLKILGERNGGNVQIKRCYL